jgi:hypothetical protein
LAAPSGGRDHRGAFTVAEVRTILEDVPDVDDDVSSWAAEVCFPGIGRALRPARPAAGCISAGQRTAALRRGRPGGVAHRQLDPPFVDELAAARSAVDGPLLSTRRIHRRN